MRRSQAVLIVGLLLLAGCKRLKTGAREHFGKEFSCPKNRVEVSARSDLRYGDLLLAIQGEPKQPPDEVKRDPERLARWKADTLADDQDLRARLNDLDVFEATGCEHRALMGCSHPGDSDGVVLSEVTCWTIPEKTWPK